MGKTLKRFLVIIAVSGLLLLAVVVGTFLYYFPKGYVPNQTDGMQSLSNTIKVSKENAVFVEELDYEIRPDTFKLKHKTRFFVEKTHVNDFDSPTLTKVQCYRKNLCYQIAYEPGRSMFDDRISLEGFYYFNKLEDTLTSNLILVKHNGENFERTCVGELRLFKK